MWARAGTSAAARKQGDGTQAPVQDGTPTVVTTTPGRSSRAVLALVSGIGLLVAVVAGFAAIPLLNAGPPPLPASVLGDRIESYMALHADDVDEAWLTVEVAHPRSADEGRSAQVQSGPVCEYPIGVTLTMRELDAAVPWTLQMSGVAELEVVHIVAELWAEGRPVRYTTPTITNDGSVVRGRAPALAEAASVLGSSVDSYGYQMEMEGCAPEAWVKVNEYGVSGDLPSLIAGGPPCLRCEGTAPTSAPLTTHLTVIGPSFAGRLLNLRIAQPLPVESASTISQYVWQSTNESIRAVFVAEDPDAVDKVSRSLWIAGVALGASMSLVTVGVQLLPRG